MTALNKRGYVGAKALKAPRFQPDYNDEVSDSVLEQLRHVVEDMKPAGFSLSPICEPGW